MKYVNFLKSQQRLHFPRKLISFNVDKNHPDTFLHMFCSECSHFLSDMQVEQPKRVGQKQTSKTGYHLQ